MQYGKYLRNMFTDVDLAIEDLLLLESFQIKYLKDRLPHNELAILLAAHPVVTDFFKSKYPLIVPFLESILENVKLPANSAEVENICQELLWEIGELIVYNKYPEYYDRKSSINWELDEIIDPSLIQGKTVIDAGAGTGKITFMVARFARVVYAIEPVSSLRSFMKEKAIKENITNVFVLDGFLDSIPLPEDSADALITSNAIGWNLEKELTEIERVLKKRAQAVHLIHDTVGISADPFKGALDTPKWNYKKVEFKIESGLKYRYIKTINK